MRLHTKRTARCGRPPLVESMELRSSIEFLRSYDSPMKSLLVALLLISACKAESTNGEGSAPAKPTAINWDGLCQRYADRCDAMSKKSPASKEKELLGCKAMCTSDKFMTAKELCTFTYCADKVGKCDNEEAGDTTIVACVKEMGW